MEIFTNVYEEYENSCVRIQGKLWILKSMGEDNKKLTFKLSFEGEEEGEMPSRGNGHAMTDT